MSPRATHVLPVLAALLAAGLALGAEAKPKPRRAVAPVPPVAVMQLAAQRLAVQGQTRPLPTRIFHPADVTPDKVTDWVVDVSELGASCDPAGCPRLVIVSLSKGRWEVVFDQPERALRLTPGRDGALLDLSADPSVCRGDTACERRYQWDNAARHFVERPNRLGQARLAGPLPERIPTTREDLPADVDDVVAAIQRACAAHGGTPTFVAADTPDLNGDGVRDWIVGSGDDACADNSTPIPMQVLVSAPGERFRRAYSASGVAYDVDVSRAPARLIVMELEGGCGSAGAAACFEDAKVWDPNSWRLAPGAAMLARDQMREEAARREAALSQREADIARREAQAAEAQRQADDSARAAERARRRAEYARREAEAQQQQQRADQEARERARREQYGDQTQQGRGDYPAPTPTYTPPAHAAGNGGQGRLGDQGRGVPPQTGQQGAGQSQQDEAARQAREQARLARQQADAAAQQQAAAQAQSQAAQAQAAQQAEANRQAQEQARVARQQAAAAAQAQAQAAQQQAAAQQQSQAAQAQAAQQAEAARQAQEQARLARQQAEAAQQAQAAAQQQAAEQARAAQQAEAARQAREQAQQAAAQAQAQAAQQQASEEPAAWSAAQSAASAESYRAYLNRFPSGEHAAEARAVLAQFGRRARNLAEPPAAGGAPQN